MTSLEQRPSLEDRIRAATRAAASTVPDDGAPPLHLSAERRRTHRLPEGLRDICASWRIWPGRPSLMRLAAPVAAASAVIAVIVASVAVADRAHPAASPASGLAGVPSYYLELASADVTGATATVSAASTAPVGQRAVIRDTLTGATLATIWPARPFDRFVMATAAADDRTFVLAAQNSSSSGLACGRTGFFSVRFNPADGQVAVTSLPVHVPATTQVDGIALSPDATKLALELAPGQRCRSGGVVPLSRPGAIKNQATGQAEISVYFLRSGTVKTWKSGTLRGSDIQPLQSEMSWASDGTLAFNYSTSQSGVWLLDTNSQSGSLLHDSRYAVTKYGLPGPWRSHGSTTVQPGWSWTGYGILTPDGQTVVAPVELTMPHAGRMTAAFGEFAASTGHPLRFLRPRQVSEARDVLPGPGYSVVWANSSGSVLVVAAPATRGSKADARSVYGVLRGHQFTPIPGAPSPEALSLFGQTVIVF